jgi:hypothetical protein
MKSPKRAGSSFQRQGWRRERHQGKGSFMTFSLELILVLATLATGVIWLGWAIDPGGG